MSRAAPFGRRSLLVVAVATWLGAASPAQAEEPSGGRFTLEMSGCVAISATALRTVLLVEIGDLLIDEAGPATPEHDRLTVRCAGNLAWVEASGTDGRPVVDRTVRVDDFPGDAAPRALALAGLELLASRSPAVRQRLEARQAPPSPAPPSQPPAMARTSSVALAVSVTRWSFLVGQGLSAWGGRASVAWHPGSLWQVRIDADAATGSRAVELGRLDGALLSAAGTAGMAGRFGWLGADLALGARVGTTRLSGSAADSVVAGGAAVWRAWGGPLAAAGVSATISRFSLRLGAEIGRSLASHEGQADGVTRLAVSGTWLALSLGGWLRL